MPLPEKALIETLEALHDASGALVEASATASETGRQMFVRNADDALKRVRDCIEKLAEAAATCPPLFGANVGASLEPGDSAEEDARSAVELLRLILTDHVLKMPSSVEGCWHLSFAGSRLVSGDRLDLVQRLTDDQIEEATPAYAREASGAVALNILRLLVNGAEGQPPILCRGEGIEAPYLEAMPGHVKLDLAQNEADLLDALKAD